MKTPKKMLHRWKNSLQIQIGLTLIALTTAILCCFGGYQYFTLKAAKLDQLNNRSEIMLERLAASLAGPLWDLDISRVEEVILAEMKEQSVFAVIVGDENV